MRIYWTGAVCLTLLVACAEPQLQQVDETLICWTEDPETGFSTGKYSPPPKTICVPIVNAPTLPESIMARAEVRNKSSDGVSDREAAEKPAAVEFSETNDRGPVAAIKNADNTVEYSVVDRDSNIVRAVDDRTVTNANDAKKLRDQIFNEVGLQAEN